MRKIHLLLLSDDTLTRQGLSKLFSGLDGFQITGSLLCSQFTPENIQLFNPNIILWDLGWNPQDYVEVINQLDPLPCPLVLLIPDPSQSSAFWNKHLSGILSRDVDMDQLSNALWAVHQGLVVFDPKVLNGLLRISRMKSVSDQEALSPREIEVLGLLGEGLSNKSIAMQLSISEHTVKFHINAILEKLGAHSRTEAIIYASRLGLISI